MKVDDAQVDALEENARLQAETIQAQSRAIERLRRQAEELPRRVGAWVTPGPN